MDSLTVFPCFLAALFASCGAAPVADSLVVVISSPVSVNRGHTATLLCRINPLRSTQDLEVRWYRGNPFDSLITLYRERGFEHTTQNPSYVGRVSFGSESGGLATGDVSLKLVNVTLEDEGDYTCYVRVDQDGDNGIVTLQVKETGSPLLLSAVSGEDDQVNVSCESAGWYPKPSLHWSNQEKALTPKSVEYSNDSSGLLTVRSWLLVSSDSKVSCSVGLPGEKEKVASLCFNDPPQPDKQNFAAPAVAGWVAFAGVLLATLALLGLLYYKKRGKKPKLRSDQAENENLLTERNIMEPIQQTDLSSFKKYYVNVTLAETGNEYLKVKNHLVRDVPNSNLKKVTCLTAISGTPGFSSGQHYWEVSLGGTNVVLKQSWWIGTTSEADVPQQPDFCPSASNGFLFLSSSPDMPDSLQLSTEPHLTLPVLSKPQTVGVYLDYDRGELSFYNVEKKYLIGRLTAKFTGEVFPFFNPGLGDKAPIRIVQVDTEEGQTSTIEGAVDARG